MTLKSSGLYVRPGGFLVGQAGIDAGKQGKAGLIADGWAWFSLVEIIERSGHKVIRNWLTYEQAKASDDSEISRLLRLIENPRPDIAGLSFSRPHIMGIVNVTPDSFSDGGAFLAADRAVRHGQMLFDEGASIVDIGGESTRPGAEKVADDEEINRVVPVIEGLAKTGAAVSIDTRKPEVMQAASKAGAMIINDVSALDFSPDSLKTAKALGLPVVLMHAQGTPENMQDDPSYGNVVLDVFDALEERISACLKAGISLANIIIDPGIGFGKTVAHNMALIEQIALFHGAGVPVLLGASRKSFIGTLTDEPVAENRLVGSLAVAQASLYGGIQMLRVHDVKKSVQLAKMLKLI